MKIMIIDGQGGGIGKNLISAIRAENKSVQIVAVGANNYATIAMQNAGASKAVCGENELLKNIEGTDVIAGPIGIVMANSLGGEITSKMAYAVSESDALKVLVPLNKCNTFVVGVSNNTLSQNIKEAVDKILKP